MWINVWLIRKLKPHCNAKRNYALHINFTDKDKAIVMRIEQCTRAVFNQNFNFKWPQEKLRESPFLSRSLAETWRVIVQM